jgi:hypothetical protein
MAGIAIKPGAGDSHKSAGKRVRFDSLKDGPGAGSALCTPAGTCAETRRSGAQDRRLATDANMAGGPAEGTPTGLWETGRWARRGLRFLAHRHGLFLSVLLAAWRLCGL